MFSRGIDERKLLPAIGLCFAVFVAGLVLLCFGCAYRNVPGAPGGAKQPATKWEQILAWNAAVAAANDGVADNVIAVESAGLLSKDQAKAILVRQAQIAAADKRITANLRTAADCGGVAAGSGASPAQLSDASAKCARSKSGELLNDINVIFRSIGDLANGGLIGITDGQKRIAIAQLLSTIQNLLGTIITELREYQVISSIEGVHAWQLC